MARERLYTADEAGASQSGKKSGNAAAERKKRERLISPDQMDPREDGRNKQLRPQALAEYVGQREAHEKLGIAMQAAKNRGEPLEHMLFSGPSGLGKTTLAHVISHEMGTTLRQTSGPALQRAGDLVGILTALQDGDVLFIDEIHRLQTVVEEFLYPAMEDYKVDFVVEKGTMAKNITIPLKRYTLVGATTRAGALSNALRNRFGLFHNLEFYPAEDLEQIIHRSASILDVTIDGGASSILARRSRGTPRIANRLLRRVRDYAQVKGDGVINTDIATDALRMEGVDDKGLDKLDRQYLQVLIDYYQGGPVGVESIAATLGEDVVTLEDVVEPYLLQIGFVQRTSRGRKLLPAAYQHLDMPMPRSLNQQRLL